MKYLFSTLFLALIAGLFAFTPKNSKDEEIKSQSEHIKSIKPGKYRKYQIYGDINKVLSGGEYTYNRSSSIYEIEEIASERLFPNKHFNVKVKETFDQSDKEKNYSFIPDDVAFPITYSKRGYIGYKQFQEAEGYAHNKNRTGSLEERLVFLDGMIYLLTSYQGPDYYQIEILVPENYGKQETDDASGEKKKKSLKEKLKAAKEFAKLAASGQDYATKKLEEEGAVKKIISYISAAHLKQQKESAAWHKTAEGKKYLADTERIREKYKSFINNQNSMYFKNMTGQTIYVYYGDNTKAAGTLAPGKTGKYICGADYWYDYDGKRFYYPNRVKRISTRGKYDKCADKMGGKAYEIKAR